MVVHVDVVVVGAGLSGIGAASILKRDRPDKSFLILESRDSVGGTWDLFRYPGVRSDSDMSTLGYSFRPWRGSKALADGDAIREYITSTVADEGLEPAIRLNHRVVSASWSSADSLWTLTAVRTPRRGGEFTENDAQGETVTITCSFLQICSGYYRYDQGYTPEIPGLESFGGRVVHPQSWPADLDYAGSRVVVIGSGATAVTLVPSMAERAEHVTMLQRSPTYIASVSSVDRLADRLRGRMPERLAYALVRAKNIGFSQLTYQFARRRPEAMKGILHKAAAQRLPTDFAIDPNLTPTYEPWDQRLCAIPDGDLFSAIRRGKADIVTGQIDRVTPGGIDLADGGHLDADVIVTATGLSLLYLGGMRLVVDGRDVDVSKTLAYKGMMLAGVPNLSMTIGYTNASWTLKADLVARYVARLLKFMDRHGYSSVTPRADSAVVKGQLTPLIDLAAGYVRRSIRSLPKQGERTPWRLHQNYVRDFVLLRTGRVTDSVRFGFAGERTPPGLERQGDSDRRVLLDRPGMATVEVDGRRIRYRVTGDGPAVLLLHGIGQSLDDWNEQHELLSARHTVYSLDLPGFAYSERLPGRATLKRLAAVLPTFLDSVGVTHAIPVVGNSLGGAVAMQFAAEHPDRVSALVLVDSAGFGSEVTLALRLLTVPLLGEVLTRPRLGTARAAVRAVFTDEKYATEARIARSYRLSQRQGHSRTTLDIARDLGTLRGLKTAWRQALLSRIAAKDRPVLLVWGARDRILPFSHLAAARAALPQAQVTVFADAGHMPQIENVEEFASTIERFLDAV
ncbi:alpha/beta fold hydrolase [Agreia sp. PsM10]|uniref:alpha/beta fold hydrolase n=1 Tax=Agreia sp. PsM10 TaxID=3030533 RepID=UPI00263AAD83|nr:alpha/beta fold hydrolase [Agreia sp. PsM10]MDN4640789.1 alpha/beta fold hydrolase [Agreia sp. PsM10]